MSTGGLKSKIKHAVGWNSVLAFSSNIVSFGVGIVLARLIAPREFGLLAMVTIFTSLAGLFVNAGTGSSVIQRKDVSQTDLSTIFWFNVGVGALLSVLIFLLAHPIARLYGEPRLVLIVQVLALQPAFGSLQIVHQYLMDRRLDFRKRTIVQMSGQLCAAGAGVALALQGLGIWALLVASWISTLVGTGLYWSQSTWRPSLVFSRASMRSVWSYSSYIFFGNILFLGVQRLDEFFVGKFLSPTTLGFYNRARSLGTTPSKMLGQVVTKSMFPILSSLQDEGRRFQTAFERTGILLGVGSSLVFSLIFLHATEIVAFLYGSRWLPAAPYLAVTAVIGFFYVNVIYKVSALNALGRSDLVFRKAVVLSTARAAGMISVVLVAGGQFDPRVLLYLIVGMTSINAIWLSWDISRVTNMQFERVLQDTLAPFALSAGLVLAFGPLRQSGLYQDLFGGHALLSLVAGSLLFSGAHLGISYALFHEMALPGPLRVETEMGR